MALLATLLQTHGWSSASVATCHTDHTHRLCSPHHWHGLLAFLVYLLTLWSAAPSAQAEGSLCATVRIEIKQEATLERQAFDAHMRINNGLDTIALEQVAINVNFADERGNGVRATSDPKDKDALFFINIHSMDGITDIHGSGTVQPTSHADIHWRIIPAPGAGGQVSTGKLYLVGATLRYTLRGEEQVTEVAPDSISVKPLPQLTLDYFLTTEVYADDAFTPEIEPPEPFTLGVRVKNHGAALARNLKIDSVQPKIIDNEQGLLIGFKIIGSTVNDAPATDSFLVHFGDVASGAAAVGRWVMTTTLSGQFTELTAAFSHADELGGELTSLIDATHTHMLVDDVRVDLPGRDAVRDFLAKDGDTLRVYESNGVDTEVTDQSAAARLQPAGPSGTTPSYTLAAPATAGFLYVQVPDPFGGAKAITAVQRSDGKRLVLDNAWLSRTRDKDNHWRYFVNLFDVASTGTYTLTFGDKQFDPRPRLQFIADRDAREGQQVSFVVQASVPAGTVPVLAAAPLPDGATFVDRRNGMAIFDWTPAIGQAGTYSITFTASDGKLETSQTASITVQDRKGTIRIPNLSRRTVAVYEQQSETLMGTLAPTTPALRVPAGTYKLRFTNYDLQDIAVAAEKATDIPLGTIRVSNGAGRTVRVYEQQSGARMGTLSPGEPVLEVPAGTYTLRFTGQQQEGLEVKAGQSVDYQLPEPLVYVTMKNEGQGYRTFTVVRRDGVEVARSNQQRPGVLLPPGDYTLRTGQYTVSITIPPASQWSQNVDFLASLRKPSRLSTWYVNPHNANFWLRAADGRLTRSYNSRSLFNGPFGFGWTFDYSIRLKRTGGGFAIEEKNGYTSQYRKNDAGVYIDPADPDTQIEDQHQTIHRFRRDHHIMEEVFDAEGRLRAVHYTTGEIHELRYTGDILQAIVEQRSGKTVYAFKHDQTGHITAMTDAMGRRFQYTYGGDDLTSVQDPTGTVTGYRYDSWHNLTEISSPDGERAILTYDVEKDWLMRLQMPGLAYRFMYSGTARQETTLRTDQEGNITRWDFYTNQDVTLITSVERLDAKLSRLLAWMGLSDEGSRLEPQSVSLETILQGAENMMELGEPAFAEVGWSLQEIGEAPRSQIKQLLLALEALRRQSPDLRASVCKMLTEAQHKFFGTGEAPPSQIVHFDVTGRELARYPFSGRVAAGSLTWLDSERVAVGDLEPLDYQLFDPASGRLIPAPSAVRQVVLGARAELQQHQEWSTDAYDFRLHLSSRTMLLALPREAVASKQGYTVYLADFGLDTPEIWSLTPTTLVLAARHSASPLLSIDLTNGMVQRLAEGSVLTLTRFGADVWALYPSHIVQYQDGRVEGLTLRLPEGLGTPQGFTPLSDGTFLVSSLREQTHFSSRGAERTTSEKGQAWQGCGGN